MAAVGPGVAESLAAVAADERLFAGMYADVLLEMVLELERFLALQALELSKFRALLVAYQVTLESVDVGEGLVAGGARLVDSGTE